MDQRQVNQNWTPANEDYLRTSFPIHRACRDGDIEQLASLLSAGEFDLYEEDDFYGWSPIHWAAYFGKLQCLMFLLQRGGSCDAPTERLNQTPSHIAAYGGYCHCLKWLLHCGATLNRQLACLRRLINYLECIGVKGCDLVSTRFSQSPAHLCAYSGHPQCLFWLVQSKCDVNIQDYMGETPLHKAARTGSMECVSLLVSQGAAVSLQNYSGNTPSDVAAAAGYTECASYIEKAAQLQSQGTQSSTQPAQTSSDMNTFHNGRTSPEGQPSVHNFISTNTYHSHPHVAMNGTTNHPHIENGLNNNNQSEDCDMEMEDGSQEGSQSAMANGFSHAFQKRDILLNQGVSQNLIPLAGRKRGREDVEEESYKRARQGDNPFPHGNQLSFSELPFANGFSDASNMDCNQNIAPSYTRENTNSTLQNPHRQSGFTKIQDPTEDPMVDKTKLNGWLFNNGHMTDHMGDHMTDDTGDHMTPVSQSMVEHYTSVSMQEGYDSLMYNSMINECHGS